MPRPNNDGSNNKSTNPSYGGTAWICSFCDFVGFSKCALESHMSQKKHSAQQILRGGVTDESRLLQARHQLHSGTGAIDNVIPLPAEVASPRNNRNLTEPLQGEQDDGSQSANPGMHSDDDEFSQPVGGLRMEFHTDVRSANCMGGVIEMVMIDS